VGRRRVSTKTIFKVASGALVTPVVRAAVAFHAVPTGQPWRRACDTCGELLRYPWLSSAFAPPARCPACGHRVGAAAYLVEAACVVAVAALVAAHRPFWETVALGWWAAWAIALVFIDFSVHRLPDRLTYPAAAGTLGMLAVAALVEQDGHAWLRALVAGVGGMMVFGLVTLLLGRHGGYGLGDAKLMLSTGMVLGWIGWPAVVIGLLVAWTAQGLLAVALLVARRANRSTSLAFGPFLVGGALASLAWLGVGSHSA
jgi:leader peptidase (prepilin peptidase)/N-methyltransferase